MCLDTGDLIAALALVVASVSLYYSKLRPAILIGGLGYVVLWRFSSNRDGKITDFKVTPALWIANVGVRPTVIEDLRLSVVPEGGIPLKLYPVNIVPIEAIERPTEFHEYGRLSCGGPFQGVGLGEEQRWACNFNFHVNERDRSLLFGPARVAIEVRCNGKPNWVSVSTQTINFGTEPYHLVPMSAGTLVESIHVYSQIWAERGA